jgi:GTP-binding protein Era
MLSLDSHTTVFDPADYKYEYDHQHNAIILGSVVVCQPIAERQAVDYGHTAQRECDYLFLHGLLHLLGYDHDTQVKKKLMRNVEKAVISYQDAKHTVSPVQQSTPPPAAPIGNNAQVAVGFFGIIGKPNVGKSSLLNAIVGQKVSIVSYKPQTTRNGVKGIYSDDNCQLVFVDTPGLLSAGNLLDKYMVREIHAALDGVDGILFVVDVTKGISVKELDTLKRIKAPVIAILNKSDLVSYEQVYPLIQKLTSLQLVDIITTSALKLVNIDLIKQACIKLSTPSVKHYSDDQVTDRSVRCMAAELIREKIFLYYEQEIPHGVGIIVTKYQDKPNVAVIEADVVCAKSSHKPILIGDNGISIKRVGVQARHDIERLIDKKVHLSLYVKVRADWKHNVNYINDLGYDDR